MLWSDKMTHLADIRIFPVKSLAGHSVAAVQTEFCGLAQDRRWMVVDKAGRFLTQRECAGMARIGARATPQTLTLSAAPLPAIDIAVPPPDNQAEPVTVWRDSVAAHPAGRLADDWISAALGIACRLVHLSDPAARPCSSTHALPGETVSFGDAFPVLLTSLASLADLNTRLASPIPMDRFRPNLVVAGSAAWAEDGWRVLRIGAAVFRVAKPCDRCVMTTIDQTTGLRPDRTEPLATLATFRRDARGVMFGQNLVPLTLGPVHVGDRIEVLEAGPPNVTPAN